MVTWRDAVPRMMKVRRGWLAVTPADHPFRIATLGIDQDEARSRFAAAMACWKDLHERAQAERAVA